MLCDKCGKNEASVFMKQVINNHQTTQHLCEHCAAELMDIGNLSLGKFFGDNLSTLFESRPNTSLTCPVCGMSYADYKQSGLLGCGECYNAFAQLLEPSIKGIHGRSIHTGKGRLPEAKPAAAAAPAAGRSGSVDEDILRAHPEILAMQERLAQLIKEEKFEEAAIVRDQIKALSTVKPEAGNGDEQHESK